MQGGTFGSRKSFADLNDAEDLGKERMPGISAIKSMVAIRPHDKQLHSSEFTQFILHRGKSEAGHLPELTRIAMLDRRGEKDAK